MRRGLSVTTGATNERAFDQMRIQEHKWEARDAGPLLPRQDPFYRPPTGFQALAMGTLLRWRRIDLAFFGQIRQRVDAWQLLYRTNNMHDEPEAAVTTVARPSRLDVSAPRPLLAYQCAIDAVADRCFPSYALRYRSRALGAIPQFEWPLIANAIAQGWTVSISDHEGLNGYFVAPREPGYRILDGVRAALSFEPLGLDRKTPVGIWGYSGGGMASSWAAEMAPTYAPEIEVVGAVLGAPVSDPGGLALRLNGTKFSGLAAVGIASLRRCYAGLDARINAHIDAEGQRILTTAGQLDTVRAGAQFADRNLNDHCDISLDELMALPEVAEVFDDVQLGQQVPSCPVLILHPQHDQIIDVRDVDAHVERYRAANGQVSYVLDRCSEHISLMLLSAPMALNWLKSRCRPASVASGRIVTLFSIALSSKAIRGYMSMMIVMLKIVTARAIGPARRRPNRRW
ncbi:lipase family protein [Mycobacteroides chelonae]|jgi:pimeloyl-ACP methyl ester carboxylesterase